MNTLFPIFVKLHQLHTLVVGAGAIGLEKLQAIYRNAPAARVRLVAAEVSDAVYAFVATTKGVTLIERPFVEADLDGIDLLILATNNAAANQTITALARQRHLLVNVADKPDLCDFYLGSVVQKGNLKVAISTNGKSPTMAKRIKEFLEELLPEEIDETLTLMQQLRDTLKEDFQGKVALLNAHTKDALKRRDHDSTT